jgi:nitroreductase
MSGAFLDLVKRRRSTRAYAPTPVPRDIVDRCLEAARLAPSACNSQPWSFVVADRDPARARLANAAFSGVYGMNKFAMAAPVLIAVILERSTYIARLGGSLRDVRYSLIDIGVACEHLVLQATEEGVGTCWFGWFSEKGVRAALGLPRTARVPVLISMGYPALAEKREKNRQALDQIRRYAD